MLKTYWWVIKGYWQKYYYLTRDTVKYAIRFWRNEQYRYNVKSRARLKKVYGSSFLAKKSGIKRTLIWRDGKRCKICLKPMLPHNLQIDHITPRSKGGSNDIKNLQLLCPNCHKAKDFPVPPNTFNLSGQAGYVYPTLKYALEEAIRKKRGVDK